MQPPPRGRTYRGERWISSSWVTTVAHLFPRARGRCFLSTFINRPKDSDFDLPVSRERQRVVIRPLAGARGYRKAQRSQDVGIKRGQLPVVRGRRRPGPDGAADSLTPCGGGWQTAPPRSPSTHRARKLAADPGNKVHDSLCRGRTGPHRDNFRYLIRCGWSASLPFRFLKSSR